MHLRSTRVVCVTLHESILPYDRLKIVTKSVANSTYYTGASARSARIHAPLVRAALHRGPETHMKGGASAERISSGLEGRGDEVAVSGCPGARLMGSLAPGRLGQPSGIEEGS